MFESFESVDEVGGAVREAVQRLAADLPGVDDGFGRSARGQGAAAS
jgi:hypothetical protein